MDIAKTPTAESTQEFRHLAAAFVDVDRMALYLLRESPLLAEAFKKMEAQTAEASAAEALQYLCSKGCRREEILWFLLGCLGKPQAWNFKEWTGLTARKAKRLASLLESCAPNIERLGKSPFGYLIQVANSGTIPPPSSLLTVAAHLHLGVKLLWHRPQFFLNLAKARLTDHVRFWTGDFHDAKVSALISVAVDTCYDETAHRVWRGKHYKELTGLDPATCLPYDEWLTRMHPLTEVGESNWEHIRQPYESRLSTYLSSSEPDTAKA